MSIDENAFHIALQKFDFSAGNATPGGQYWAKQLLKAYEQAKSKAGEGDAWPAKGSELDKLYALEQEQTCHVGSKEALTHHEAGQSSEPVDIGNVLNTIYYWAAHAARADNLDNAKFYAENARNHANNAIMARLDKKPPASLRTEEVP